MQDILMKIEVPIVAADSNSRLKANTHIQMLGSVNASSCMYTIFL